MRRILIIGIGAGDPDHLTVQAIDAINRAQVVFIPDKGAEKQDLRRLRLDICRRFMTHEDVPLVDFATLPRRSNADTYGESVAEWHGRVAEQYADLLRRHVGENGVGAFLVWGDPSLYDSTMRIVEAIRAGGDLSLDYEVIPGITSVQALAAQHRVALNRIGEAVHVTTGRRLGDVALEEVGSTVVMLDGAQAFARLERDDLEIFWGAYLGTPDQVLVSGPLADVREEILRIRAEMRRAKGWIMDVYLLRVTGG